MFRLIASALLVVALSGPLAGPLGAEEVCIACEGPEVSYRCDAELPTNAGNAELRATVGAKACATVLAKAGGHKVCHAVKGEVPCAGSLRAVTLTDYQRAIAGNGQASTYEPGALELARRNVHDTWICVTSLFGDC